MAKIVGITASYRGAIGILGGSFDPPHYGHLCSAERTRKFIGLTQVWWLVAWQHALKSRVHQENFAFRVQNVAHLIRHMPSHKVCDREKSAQMTYSLYTIRLLKKNYPHAKFVWILGSDSFISLYKWHQWQKFMQEIPLIVVARDAHSRRTLMTSKVAQFFRKTFRHRFTLEAGCWSLHNVRIVSISSSTIRQMKGKNTCAKTNNEL